MSEMFLQVRSLELEWWTMFMWDLGLSFDPNPSIESRRHSTLGNIQVKRRQIGSLSSTHIKLISQFLSLISLLYQIYRYVKSYGLIHHLCRDRLVPFLGVYPKLFENQHRHLFFSTTLQHLKGLCVKDGQ